MEKTKDSSGTRLLIADDHAIFAESLRMLLEKTYAVVGIVTDGRALVSEATRLKPDVLVFAVAVAVAFRIIWALAHIW
jgi:DNA-binding NarL/FixJ family response regulator